MFMRNSLCLNVLNDSISVLSRCMCVRGRGGGFLVIIQTKIPPTVVSPVINILITILKVEKMPRVHELWQTNFVVEV